jgi:hypothetical protein
MLPMASPAMVNEFIPGLKITPSGLNQAEVTADVAWLTVRDRNKTSNRTT